MVGFGASGRNGGWVSGFFSGPARAYERSGGRAGLIALQRAMFATVKEIGSVIAEQHIDADFLESGQLTVALGRAQAARLRERARRRAGSRPRRGGSARAGRRGAARSGCGWPARASRASRRTSRACTPPSCSAAWPPRWSASAWSSTRARPSARSARGAALTPAGALRARWVVRATEGYTAGLRGLRRAARADEQLDDRHRAAAGRALGARSAGTGSELMDDGAHVYVYLQRTADGRIAIGGRGVPYRYGSRTDGRGATADGDRAEPARASWRRCSRRPRGRGARPRLVGRARRAARLVRVGRRRSGQRPRLGGRLRRRGGGRREPRRPHAARPAARASPAS